MGCAQSTEAAPEALSVHERRASHAKKHTAPGHRRYRFKTAVDAALFIQRMHKRKFEKRAQAAARARMSPREHDVAAILQSAWRAKQDRAWIKRQSVKFNENHHIKQVGNASFKMSKDQTHATKLNDYTLTKLLGKGSYGEVYKASHTVHHHHESVAIKVLKRPSARARRASLHPAARNSSVAEGLAEMLRKEVGAQRKLNHPNVVELLEVVDDPKIQQIYLVMELITGGTLAEPVEEKRVVPEAELRHWMRGLVLGLEHLHLNGATRRAEPCAGPSDAFGSVMRLFEAIEIFLTLAMLMACVQAWRIAT